MTDQPQSGRSSPERPEDPEHPEGRAPAIGNIAIPIDAGVVADVLSDAAIEDAGAEGADSPEHPRRSAPSR